MKMMIGFFCSTIKEFYAHLWLSDIVFALFSLFIFSSVHQKLTSKGPMLWPVMGIIPSLAFHASRLHDWVTAALIKSGGTFHYRGMWMGGCRGIVTSDPSKIEYMLKTNFKNFPKGKIYRERFYELLGDGIFNADGDLWKFQRRVANAEMHSSKHLECAMQSVSDLVHNKLLRIFKNLEQKAGPHQIDLQEILLRFTFDNICTTAFGVDPGCLALDLPDIPFANAFEEATESTLIRFLMPPFVWKPMKFLGLGSEKRLKEGVKIVHEFVERTVRERKLELSSINEIKLERADLLSKLITIQYTDEQGKKTYGFSDNLLRDFCISFILAGRDTSSVGLAWFFWLVTKNPNVERKILDEIYEIIKQRQEPSNKRENNDIVFTVEELKKMVYLQAALSESLRLYPPVPIDFKEVEEDDMYPDGTPIKKGDRVIYNIYSMARMESMWGKDCEEFKPERWIQEGEFISENQFKYAVFNGGPRLCVGKKFAYLQMKMVAASMLLRYVVKVVEGHQVCPKITTTLYMKHGLLVTLEPREKD